VLVKTEGLAPAPLEIVSAFDGSGLSAILSK
jgi:hypothetical protein